MCTEAGTQFGVSTLCQTAAYNRNVFVAGQVSEVRPRDPRVLIAAQVLADVSQQWSGCQNYFLLLHVS